MKSGILEFTTVGKKSSDGVFHLMVLSLIVGAIHMGCMESGSPGAIQTQTTALRSESTSSPQCRDETILLVLDEDAIDNRTHHDCSAKKEDDDDRHGDRGEGRKESDEDKDGRKEEISVKGMKGYYGQSDIGKRSTIAFFANSIGKEMLLPGGEVGDEGWFAPTSIRIGWKCAGPDSGDGLRNYLEAGPGLGGPDAKGKQETLLENVPNLVPLRAKGLARLEGRSVCAVVLDGEVQMSYNPRSGNITGPNLGKIAFQVLGTETASHRSASTLPSVKIRILDAEAVCNDPLVPFLEAPIANSKCDPKDVERPACAIQRNLIKETWDTFDSTLWKGDGDQVVGDGYFSASDGATATSADWISPCPVTVDSNTELIFSNRIHLVSSSENDFAESGALFMVNVDNDGSFNNYVFINVGYTMKPSKVFVESFGSNGGKDFDQFEESSLAYNPSQIFSVDLNILPNAYQIAIGGETLDTILLAAPILSEALFEVGVQQDHFGLRGQIDMTTLTKLCQKENVPKCRKHSWSKGEHRKRLSSKCHTRNSYIRMARERIKHCAHPSMGIRILCKMRESPESD